MIRENTEFPLDAILKEESDHSPVLRGIVVTKTWNELKPPKIAYSHLQPPTATYNHLKKIQQPPTTIYNHLKNTYNHSQTI